MFLPFILCNRLGSGCIPPLAVQTTPTVQYNHLFYFLAIHWNSFIQYGILTAVGVLIVAVLTSGCEVQTQTHQSWSTPARCTGAKKTSCLIHVYYYIIQGNLWIKRNLFFLKKRTKPPNKVNLQCLSYLPVQTPFAQIERERRSKHFRMEQKHYARKPRLRASSKKLCSKICFEDARRFLLAEAETTGKNQFIWGIRTVDEKLYDRLCGTWPVDRVQIWFQKIDPCSQNRSIFNGCGRSIDMLEILWKSKPVSFLYQDISKHYATMMNVWKRKNMQQLKVIMMFRD